jgi:putative nucleotidyltransferase with HDIG domain
MGSDGGGAQDDGDLRDTLGTIRLELLRVHQRLDAAWSALDEAREEAERERAAAARARKLAEEYHGALKAIHGGVFGGDVHALVLHACLRLTDATRGVYVTARAGERLVRAAVGVDGLAVHGRLPRQLDALCERVLALDDTVVCGDPDTLDLPAPAAPEARFRNCAAVPVTMRGDVNGVLVVLDKREGEFDETDLETLLHVGDQASVAVDNASLQRELEQVYMSTVGLLADAVEAKDPYTRGHCQRVSQLAQRTARQLNLDEEARHSTCLAALLHDVGKIGVSDGILNKPGPLLPEEVEVVRAHARIGHDLLRGLPALERVAAIVLHHHEAFDGSGYPGALAGEAIPIESRIVTVIDAYCAMMDRRAYKEAASEMEARAELRRCAGTQFDPRVVEAVLAVLDADGSGDDRNVACGLPLRSVWRRHTGRDGAPDTRGSSVTRG